jgi:hypothetical protein
MNSAVAAVLILALLAANLPFANERLFSIFALKAPSKAFGWRLVELMVNYALVGVIAYLLEQKIEPVHHQDWEFYAVTACMFLVLAAPGFVYRFLWKP